MAQAVEAPIVARKAQAELIYQGWVAQSRDHGALRRERCRRSCGGGLPTAEPGRSVLIWRIRGHIITANIPIG